MNAGKDIQKKEGKDVASVTDDSPESKYPKFLSTTGLVIMIALTSGHTAAVSPDDPTPLHPRFHRRAVELGAMPESIARGMDAAGLGVEEDAGINRKDIILRNIAQMVEQCDLNPTLLPQLFTNDGRPDSNSLSQRCGFTVRAPERDKMWEEYQGEVA